MGQSAACGHGLSPSRSPANRAPAPPARCLALQNPEIQRMTQAIAQDPVFMEMAREMQVRGQAVGGPGCTAVGRGLRRRLGAGFVGCGVVLCSVPLTACIFTVALLLRLLLISTWLHRPPLAWRRSRC